MSATINPDIVTDGLVLCYDAANNDCFRGEPTTNLITSNFIAGGNTTVVLSDEIDQYGITRSLNKATINSTTGWARIYINSSIGIPVINQNYTISMWIKRSGATEVRAGWEPEVGPADGYRRPEVESGYYGIAGGPQPNVVSDEWTYITYTFKYTSTTTSNLVLFFYINGNGGQILFSDPQIEVKPYDTPYVTGTRGGTVATGGGLFDLSNNNNHGTIVRNAVPTASFYNSGNRGSLVFDGVNDYISSNNVTLNFNNGFTISQWLKVLNISSNLGSFQYRNGSNNINIILLTSGSIRLESYGSGGQLYSSSGSFNLNQWYNLVCTFSGTDTDGGSGMSTIYLNGISIASGTRNGFNSTTADIIVGAYPSSAFYFNGYISNNQFYNQCLTPQQILDNYRATKGRYGL